VTTLSRGHEVDEGCIVSSLRLISNAGESDAFHSLEFITARIANPHTRAAYGRAIAEFCDWCEQQGVSLPALSSPVVAAYFHELGTRLSASSSNQHLSAIRQWLEWLTRSGVLRFNPAAAVRGARLSREEGKTPVLERDQARRLFTTFERPDGLIQRRDRAILAVMLYGFARVGALVRMRVRDFQEQNGSA
jgi:site-specific recombinase XerD